MRYCGMVSFDYLDLLGKPFERGARGPESYDCYGLVRVMFERSGRPLPDFQTPGSLEEIEDLVGREEARFRRVPPRTPGSLITFRVDGHGAHVGFMLEGDWFLHCIEGSGVARERLTGGHFTPLAFYEYA